MKRKQRPIILGVTESDCHVVANRLIELLLRQEGFPVINLGVCTTVAEFATAYAEHPETLAILIGSLNGHGYEDLQELPTYRHQYAITCPIILGGNLSVGSHKTVVDETRYYALGITHILRNIDQILPLLATLTDVENDDTASLSEHNCATHAGLLSYLNALPGLPHLVLPTNTHTNARTEPFDPTLTECIIPNVTTNTTRRNSWSLPK